ncbi:MAG: hypothetical protein IJR87_01915, partial [Bacteroidaceae bacterium]|nr:hypothetical protein [Bacteroidaceae bacterium]
DTKSDNAWEGEVLNCYTDHARITSSQFGPTTGQSGLSADDFASGAIAVGLGDAFRQNLGEDNYPVLDKTHSYVKEITEIGYATMYIPETSVEVPEGVQAYTGLIVNDLLWLRPVQGVVMLGQAVVLKGAAGYYSFKPVDVGVGYIHSDLRGTKEPLEADGSQYVLAQKDGVVGFYKAEGTIAAGKAYLLGGAHVKGFGLSLDGETSIAEIAENAENDTIYDLSGRRVEKAQKGIYIINGKKVLK